MNNKELSKSKKYLSFHLQNDNSPILLLFNYLKKCHPVFPDNQIEKKIVFSKIWPKDVYSNKRLSNLCGKLFTHLENFISTLELEEQAHLKQALITQSSFAKNDKKIFTEQSKKWLNTLNQLSQSSEKYHLMMQYHETNLEFGLRDQYTAIQDHYFEVKKHLNLHYYSYQLKICCEEFSRNEMFNIKNKVLKNAKKALRQTRRFRNSDHALIHIYHDYLNFLLNPDQSGISKIMSLLKDYSAIIARDELKTLFIILGKFYTQKRMKGNDAFLIPHLDLYKLGLKEKFICSDDEIGGSIFLNIAFLSLATGELKYAFYFINHYRSKLPENERYEAVMLSLAQFRFTTDEIDKALILFNKVFLRYDRYRIRKQYMRIRLYYEFFLLSPLDNFDELDKKIVACYEFFKGEVKINESRRQRVFSLLRIIRKMKTAYLNNDTSLKAELLNKIPDTDVIFKSWLINKIKALP